MENRREEKRKRGMNERRKPETMNERGLRGNETRCAIYLSEGQTKGGESAANETDIACPPTERNGRLQQSASCVRHAHAVVLPPAYAKSNVMYKQEGGEKEGGGREKRAVSTAIHTAGWPAETSQLTLSVCSDVSFVSLKM